MDQREVFGELQEVIKDASLPSQHKGGWTQQDFKFNAQPGLTYWDCLKRKVKEQQKEQRLASKYWHSAACSSGHCASWGPQKGTTEFLITHSDTTTGTLRINFFFNFNKAVHVTFSLWIKFYFIFLISLRSITGTWLPTHIRMTHL